MGMKNESMVLLWSSWAVFIKTEQNIMSALLWSFEVANWSKTRKKYNWKLG